MAGQVMKRRRLMNPRYRGKFRIEKKYAGGSRKIRRAVKSGADAKAKYYGQRSYARAYQTPGHGLHNPRRRRRNMTPAQIKYFGTKRQKAALKNRGLKRRIRRARKLGSSTARQTSYYLKAHLKRKRARNQGGIVSQVEHAAEDAIRGVERAAEQAIGAVTRQSNRGRKRRSNVTHSRRRANVGEILTVVPANPGRRRRAMAATHKRRRRRASGRRLNRRRSNPTMRLRYHRRNRGHRRRNPDFLQGDIGAVVGVLGGAAVTKIITGFLPSNLSTGIPGYISTGLVAFLAGNLTGRFTKNRALGKWMTVGGLVMVGLQVAADFFPQLSLPFTTSGTSGMGLISSSNFYVPQVNMPGSMASFVTPAGIPAPVVVPSGGAMRGFGATGTSVMNSGLRRVGRLR